MINDSKQRRIKSLYRMLLEMATGNLSFRIELDGSDLQFDEVAGMLNDAAAKMQGNEFLLVEFTSSITHKEPVADIIQKVQDYILNNLEEPLPSTNELSKMFGTNEFTLKEGFRDISKISIYQFYNNERLKRAHYLIEQTTMPLKVIAYKCGFKDYNNFSKAFKKKYNCSPSEIIRLNKQG